MSSLFTPYPLGRTTIKNRIVMAPMTRSRRTDRVAAADTAEYYQQRAGAGLIVTEGTFVSEEAQGYVFVPGIWTQEQVAGWSTVTSAVHAADGVIFAQLWHVGRVSHSSLQPDGAAPVSSSAKAPGGPYADEMAYGINEDGSTGFMATTPPRALELSEMARIVQDFTTGARNAHTAGFDGVEIHGANGYLFEQFLNPHINDRVDGYGGSIENRARLLLEVIDAAIDELGADRVGVRISPFGQLFDNPPYDETHQTYMHLAGELAKRPIAYVHINDQTLGGERITPDFLGEFRRTLGKTVILAGRMSKELAKEYVELGLIDLAAFGQLFIANPDLPRRLESGAALATPDRDTYYGGGLQGYTDYPALDDETSVGSAIA